MSGPANETPGRLAARNELALGILCLIALALLPLAVTSNYGRHILILSFVYAVVASNWDLSLGYGGIFNFGHLALFGLGVYAYALLTRYMGLDPWIALAASGVVASLAAAVVTVPILRLKGIYIVLITFGFSQFVMQVILSWSDVTGGMQGLVRVEALTLAGHNLLRDGKMGYFYIALAMLGLSTLLLRALIRSRVGLGIVAVRDNEEYAASRGVSLARHRFVTLAASALFTGIAGGFYAAYQRSASTDVFGMSLATTILSMVLLGGTSTTYGAIVASLILTVLAELLSDFGAWRPIIIAGLIIVTMLAVPTGLMGLLRGAVRRVVDARMRPPAPEAGERVPATLR